MSNLEEPIDVAEVHQYLFRRLREVGVQSIHGVPGDYNLVALDYVEKAGCKWVGNCNELNAGYAADGYARIHGIAAIVTTFGVGELSAINALAGSYSEYVPVVHIVGTPSTISQRNGMLLHHTLGNGDFRVFEKMSSNISVALERLNNPRDVAEQIDYAIRECYVQSRPVYLSLPTDVVQKKVEGKRLKTKIDLNFADNDQEKEDYVVDVVLKYLHKAENAVIVVDACAIRHRALKETHELIKRSGLPVFVTPMGKGAIDETLPNYGGVYAGTGSNPGVKERVENSDLIINIGGLQSDFNTAGFSYTMSQLKTIDFHSYMVKVRYSEYPGVRMNGVLAKVAAKLTPSEIKVQKGPEPTNEIPAKEKAEDEGSKITHTWFWPRLGQWLKPKDIVITETGTANFGIWTTRFPKDVTAIAQVLWGSIGYATGSTQGAALAASEDRSQYQRTILITGDGSLQLTAQEISTMLRHNLDPIIFVICNKGYTIERYIHGMDESYNDVQEWDYKALPAVFGAKEGQAKSYVVKSKGEVEKLFGDEEFSKQGEGKLRFVELYMEKEDAPEVLKATAEESAKINSKLE